MSAFTDPFESDADQTPTRRGQLSYNGQWLFGALFAGLVMLGFAFGVWAGASKPKTVEVVKEVPEKPKPPAVQPSPQQPQQPEPKVREPEPKKPEPEPKKPEPMDPEPKKPEPEPKKPDPKTVVTEPKPKETEPKKADVKPVAFKEVRPILMNYCGNCHGNAGKPKAGIDLKTVASIKKGGEDGDIVKPGDPKKSPLYESITAGRMPPDGKPAPNPKELQLIHDWILSGAKERRRPGRGHRGWRTKRRGRVELTAEVEAG